jgi:DNA topoisomerase VI subunit A
LARDQRRIKVATRRRTRRRYEEDGAGTSEGPFPRIKKSQERTIRENTKSARLVLFRLRIIYALSQFKKLTVRMLFYRLVSVYDYPNDRNFYKRLEYSLKVLRKLFLGLNDKFDDPTRKVSLPPLSESKIEL